MEIDLFDDIVDDASVHEMRVGQIGTVKGKLENVRFGGGRTTARKEKANPHWGTDPSLCIAFADWGMLSITLRDHKTAKAIPFPLGTYVGVKVQCISEDAEVMALAMWELGDNPVPIAMAEPVRFNTPSCTTVSPQAIGSAKIVR